MTKQGCATLSAVIGVSHGRKGCQSSSVAVRAIWRSGQGRSRCANLAGLCRRPEVWQRARTPRISPTSSLVDGANLVYWFSGSDASLQFHVGKIDATSADQPRLLQSAPIQLDSRGRANPPRRSTSGEYVGITFLGNGGIGVAAPIYNPTEKRFGFTWLRFATD